MLTQIETKMDQLLSSVSTLDEHWVRKQENLLERERRKRQREERNKNRLQNKDRGRREKKTTLEGQVKKRVGKPVMERSKPLDNKQQTRQAETDNNSNTRENTQSSSSAKEQQDMFTELFGV